MKVLPWLRSQVRNGHRGRLAAYLAVAIAFGAGLYAQAEQRERDRAQDIENAYQGCLSTNASRAARAKDRAFFANQSPIKPELIPGIEQDPAFEIALRAQQARTAAYLHETAADHTLDQLDCGQRRRDLEQTGTTTTTRGG